MAKFRKSGKNQKLKKSMLRAFASQAKQIEKFGESRIKQNINKNT